jgi:hypothetical protein
MNIPKALIVVALALFLTSASFAEEPFEPPKPTAEHKELEMWLGSWEGSGEMKPGPFGPGGPMKWTEKCSWFADAGFHVICKSKGETPMGPSQGLGIIGYDPVKKVYTHYGVDSGGWVGLSEGNRSGDVWTFQSKETMEGKTFHSRFTMKMESPTEMTFSWEMSEDGETWTVMMDGTTKKK